MRLPRAMYECEVEAARAKHLTSIDIEQVLPRVKLHEIQSETSEIPASARYFGTVLLFYRCAAEHHQHTPNRGKQLRS